MAQLTGFEADTLRQIISRTMEQVSAMEAARGRVEDATQTIASAAQAQAGTVLRQRLTEWQSEYSDIKNKLDILNGQVQTLLSQRTNTDDSTASSAAA
jgi:seryl-tRNA synthetase